MWSIDYSLRCWEKVVSFKWKFNIRPAPISYFILSSISFQCNKIILLDMISCIRLKYKMYNKLLHVNPSLGRKEELKMCTFLLFRTEIYVYNTVLSLIIVIFKYIP